MKLQSIPFGKRATCRRIVMMMLVCVLSVTAFATDFLVTNGNNAGVGSLRQAITSANADVTGTPLTISFSYTGVINVTTSLPTITKRVTIDGGSSTSVIVSGPGGDNLVALIVLGAGSGGSIVKNLTIRNTGLDGVRFAVATTGTTLENLIIMQTGTHYMNRGILASAAQTNLTIRNVDIRNVQDGWHGIYFADKVTNLQIDGLKISGGSGTTARGIHFQGVVSGFVLKNSLIDLDDPATADDGDFGLFFVSNAANVEIDNTIFRDVEINGIYVAGTASNFAIKNSTFDNLDGHGAALAVRFIGNTNTITITGNNFFGDQRAVPDDADYAVYMPAIINQKLTITNNKFHDYDLNALRIGGNHANNHDDVLIKGNEFLRNGTGGADNGAILFGARNTTSDGAPVLFTENTFRDNHGVAIGVYPWNGVVYTIPNLTISKNIIYNNKGTQGAVDVRWINKIVVTQNSIYNNTATAFDLSGGANCGYEGNNRPLIVSSTETAAGVYNVVVKMPTLCGTNACSLELFASNAATTGNGGQHYVNTFTGLGAGNRTLTGVTAAGIAALNQAPFGFWSATLKLNNNCGTSEFSNRISIKPTGPAGVSAGIQVWLKPDDFNGGNLVANTGWQDVSGNNRHFNLLNSDPASVKAGVNFNNYVNFDGDDFLYGSTYGYVTAFTAGEAITVLRSAANNVARGFPYDFGGTPRGQHYTWSNGALYTSFGTNDRLGYNTSTKVVVDVKPATTITGGAIDAMKWNIFGTNGGAGSWAIDFNGGQQSVTSTTNTANFSLPANREYIAYCGGTKYAFAGDIAETVLYSRRLSAIERKQVNTYLAIRNGLTLYHDYVASNGVTILWNYAGNAGYNNSIAGIMRDDLGIIQQRQSFSVSQPDGITISLGDKIAANNADNEFDFTNNNSALIWGSNNLAATYTTAVTGTNVTARFARVWKVQKTNFDDNQEIVIKMTGTTDKNYLIISNTANFATISHEVKMNKDGTIRIPSSWLANGSYFTFGRQQFYPGGVTNGLATWVRADEGFKMTGTNITTADDQGPSQRIWTKMYNRPLNWNSTGYNYNPFIQFPNNEHLNTPPFTAGFTNGDVFSVQASSIVRDGSAVPTYSFPWQLGGNTATSVAPSYRNNTNAMWLNFGSTTRTTFGYGTKDLSVASILNTSAGANKWSASIDGRAYATNAANTTSFAGNNYIGAGAGAFFTGTLPEVIMYNRQLDATEKLKVNSYLAVKYGITLDQSTATNYLSSDGTIIWNSANNAGFKANIAALGRDDMSTLNQKQSRSANAATASYISFATGEELLVSNEANGDSIENDKSFFFWSDNNGAITYSTAVTSEKATVRMNRVWKVNKANWADKSVTLKMHYPTSNVYLLISTDPTFATVDQETFIGTSGVLSLNSAQLPDGAYFTFAKELKGPAFVNGGVQFWLRADDGTSTGALWSDFSGNDFNAVQNTGTLQPAFNTSSINFNPGFVLDGTDDYMDFSGNATIAGTNQFTIVSVSSRGTQGTTDLILGQASNATNSMGYGYNASNKLILTATTTGAIGSTGTYSTPNVPMLHGITRGASNFISFFTNGVADGPAIQPAAWSFLSNNLRLGMRVPAFADYFGGAINEVVVYNKVLNAAELLQVNAYLSLKYGLTLNNGTSNYVASDGTTLMWTAAKNGTYINGIAGIGRDEKTSLFQKQSRSVVDPTITIGLGAAIAATNAENTGEMDDMSFFTWASNGDLTTFSVPTTGLPNTTARMARVWKVDRTNWTDQDITIKVAQNGDRYLLVNATDPTFAAAGTTEYPINSMNGTVTLNTADLPDGAYFTVASKIVGPACVNSNIAAWLRADYGVSAGNWSDFSGNQKNGSQANAAAAPTLNTNGVNFNPAIKLNGTSQFLNIAGNLLNAGNNDYSIIAVTRPANIVEKQVIYLGGAAANQGIHLQYNNNAGAGGLATIEASWGNNGFWGGATAVNKTDLITSTYNKTIGRRLRQDGTQVGTHPDITSFNYVQALSTIGSFGAASFYQGDIAEVIVYNNKALTGAELQRVESYLALKYGITMSAGTVDYIGSDGTTIMWSATDNAGYNYRITGIGRDDCTELYQKQSINANGGHLSIAVAELAATNIENLNTIDNNNSYLVIGDNNLSTDYNTSITGANELTARMARIWKADKTNWADGDVQFKLNNGNEKIFLVVSTDNVFDATDAAYQLDADGNVTVSTAEFPDGAYFTFAKSLRGPGYVNVGINLWLRADDELSSNEKWIDYSGNDNDATQADPALQPVLTTAATNYNPGFVFNGTSHNMGMAIAKFPTGTAARTLIGVGTSTDLTGTRYLLGWGTAATSNYNSIVNVANQAYYSGFSNDIAGAAGTAVLGMPQEMTATWVGGTNGLATLYSKTKSLGALAKSWNTGVAGGAFIGKLATNIQYWKGPINEVVVFNRAIADFERLRISSYLAMKYGYTIDQTANTNYVATDWDGSTGTIYWDATANATYKNNITGIGRDDKTGLDQKQSRNTNTVANGNMIAIGLNSIETTNQNNTAEFTDDLSFLLWGDDGATGLKINEYPASLDPGGCSKITRLQREWKVQKTGTPGVVQMNMYLAGIVPSSTSISDLKLLVNTSNDFTAATTVVIAPASYDAATQTATFTNLNFENGEYFTLVTDLTNEAPGGVKDPLYTWYRADKGVGTATGVNTWADQGANGKDLSQATAAAQPAYNTTNKLFNFNPSLTFNGSSTVLSNTAVTLNAATNGEDVFAVILPRSGDFIGFGRTTAGAQQFTRFASETGILWVSRTSTTTAGSISTPTNPANSIVLANFHRNNAGAASTLLNGTVSVSGTINHYPVQNQLNIGSRRLNDGSTASNDLWYNGEIAEVAIFNKQLTATEREKVASYFGIKYGLTLSHNYVDPDNTILWDVTANTGFNFNITGIGRDDCNGLHQKQSKSVNSAEALITIGHGMGIVATNVSNANDMSNKSALLAGDDNGNRTVWTLTNAPADRKRIARTWKIQETNTIPSITIQAPSNASAATVKLPLEKAGKVYLLVSTTSDFTGAVTEIPMSLNGDNWEASYDFNSGEFFTFATGGDCVDNLPLLTTYGTTTAAATDKCYVDGWILFKDPSDAEKYIAGIYDPAQLIDRSKITASIDVNTAFAAIGKGDVTQASRLMRRMLQINCTDCYDAVANPAPAFTVRMFYSSTEKGEAEDGETNSITGIKTNFSLTDPHNFTWFKASNKTIPQVVSSLTPAGIGAAGQEWADGSLTTGSIDGVEYVDFDGVNGFSTFGGIWTVNVNKVLPVSWGEVKAVPVNNQKITISWTTASEYNNHHFDVERSEGNGVFVTIATVGGKGTTSSTSHYAVDDKNVVAGVQYSYRVKQVDIDGKETHSRIVSARLNSGNGKSLQIRPNPVVTETLRFEMNVPAQSRVQASIFDAAGKLLGSAGFRTITGANEFKMSVRKLQPGVYMLKVVMEDGTMYTERFYKR